MSGFSIKNLKAAVGNITGVFHVGSHVGTEVDDYVSNGVENITWVEANYLILNKLIKYTAPYGKNQMWLPYCLHDIDDQLRSFNISNNEESSSLLEFGTDLDKYYPEIHYVNKISVLTKRLDTVVKLHTDIDWSKFNVLVTDCQGSDLDVLKGCGDLLRSQELKVIKTEFNFGEMYKGNPSLEQVTEYLLKFGFIPRFYFHASGWGDQYFVRN